MNVVWFKRDLRIYDNPALKSAMESGPTIAVYCLSEWEWDKHHISPAQRSLILDHLETLSHALAALNVPLIILKTSTFGNTADELKTFIRSKGVKALFFNKQYEWNERGLEARVSQCLADEGVSCHGYDDQCAIAPGTIINKQGECFKVFTAFKRSYFEHFYSMARPIAPLPAAQETMNISSDLELLRHVTHKHVHSWPVGEAAAHQLLNDFVDDNGLLYNRDRDFPSINGTSGLSPYLAIGVLSTRQCIQVALNASDGQLDDGNPGLTSWINELIWRDFYRHLMFFHPDLSKHKAFKQETEALPWRKDNASFKRWCEGTTGFPIVDAAMRQLNQTGWMHNRLRMIVAMFLTKDLFIDWRWGEQYFMSKLVDGDLASNNGGWQWSASTGVDAAPYFRIFNPTRQSERFDPEGTFIRKYLPELAGITGKSIHAPTSQQRAAVGYPEPMVDHKLATEQTKAWFKGETIG
ncbi:deoxyribodipyrimidine photo-lyase [Litoribrevibacter albus]|uniref:Deoxyribodipyrimidine photo-lyase n=1 Tax=Litoribrevibacter albus TaxID=1473156 RepID=A0AA37S9V7_9GAMM|nr:deoxyribodipyrimidine photo-lyase [Litoribrevibacter albus]GLQ30799.1 deoxyribodipyrimidine photo-lyase [Litoribrevibacter albus]